MESRQYQLRVKPALEAGLQSVWLKNRNITDNLTRIVQAGVAAIQLHNQLKRKHSISGGDE